MIAAARPFADMLFQRETEGQVFDTPEKRAGLERRLRELAARHRRRELCAVITPPT